MKNRLKTILGLFLSFLLIFAFYYSFSPEMLSSDTLVGTQPVNFGLFYSDSDYNRDFVKVRAMLANSIDLKWGRITMNWKYCYFVPQKLYTDTTNWGKVKIGVEKYIKLNIEPFMSEVGSGGGIIVCLAPSAPVTPRKYYENYSPPVDTFYTNHRYGMQLAGFGDRDNYWEDNDNLWKYETDDFGQPHWIPSDIAMGQPTSGDSIPYIYTWEYFCEMVAFYMDSTRNLGNNCKVYYELMNEPFNRCEVSYSDTGDKRKVAPVQKLEKVLYYGTRGIKRHYIPRQLNESWTDYFARLDITSIPSFNGFGGDGYIIFGHLNDKKCDASWDSTRYDTTDAGKGWNEAVLCTLNTKAGFRNKKKIYCNAFGFHPYHFDDPYAEWSWCKDKDTFLQKITYISGLLSTYSWSAPCPLFITELGWHGTLRTDVTDTLKTDNDHSFHYEWGRVLLKAGYSNITDNRWSGSSFLKGWLEYIYANRNASNYTNSHNWTNEDKRYAFEGGFTKRSSSGSSNEVGIFYRDVENKDVGGGNDQESYNFFPVPSGWFGDTWYIRINYIDPKRFSDALESEVTSARFMTNALHIIYDYNSTHSLDYPLKIVFFWTASFSHGLGKLDNHWGNFGHFHSASNHLTNPIGTSGLHLGWAVGPAKLEALAMMKFKVDTLSHQTQQQKASLLLRNDNISSKQRQIGIYSAITDISNRIKVLSSSTNIGTTTSGNWRSGRCDNFEQRACLKLPSDTLWTDITISHGKHSVDSLYLTISSQNLTEYIPWSCPHTISIYKSTSSSQSTTLDTSKFCGSTSSAITIDRTDLRNYYYLWIVEHKSGWADNHDYPDDFIWGNWIIDGENPPSKRYNSRILPSAPSSIDLAPNPFGRNLNVTYNISEGNQVRVIISLYDISGRRIMTLLDKVQKSGKYTLKPDLSNLNKAGVYFCKYSLNGKCISVKKILYLPDLNYNNHLGNSEVKK